MPKRDSRGQSVVASLTVEPVSVIASRGEGDLLRTDGHVARAPLRSALLEHAERLQLMLLEAAPESIAALQEYVARRHERGWRRLGKQAATELARLAVGSLPRQDSGAQSAADMLASLRDAATAMRDAISLRIEAARLGVPTGDLSLQSASSTAPPPEPAPIPRPSSPRVIASSATPAPPPKLSASKVDLWEAPPLPTKRRKSRSRAR